MNPVFDGKLLLVLSIFCFNGVFGRERGIKIAAVSGVEGIEAQRSRILHHKGRSSGLFNVMSFGARADSQTDDTRVRTLFSLSLFETKNYTSLLLQNSWCF
jgi:hypothetical protein